MPGAIGSTFRFRNTRLTVRAVVQRVSRAAVRIDGETVTSIGPGLMILLGVAPDDTGTDLDWLCGKVARMRIFEDDDGKMNRSVAEAGGTALVVSQFTLHASTRKGNRPSFLGAAGPEHAEPLYRRFCDDLEALLGAPVARGRFGAMMEIDLVNHGPVTIVIDSKNPE